VRAVSLLAEVGEYFAELIDGPAAGDPAPPSPDEVDYQRVVAGLGAALKDKHPRVRAAAAWALWKSVKDDGREGPVLAEVLARGDRKTREVAATSLGEMGKKAKGATRALRLALKDKLPRVRVEAALALWKVTRRAKLAAPMLLKCSRTRTRLSGGGRPRRSARSNAE
jgi:hypothetical protein